MKKSILKQSQIDTPLGNMIAIGNDDALYLLAFEETKGLEKEIDRLAEKTRSQIVPGSAKSIELIKNEISLYFLGTLQKFKTPLYLSGTPFQNKVWCALLEIPFGKTSSYQDVAIAIGKRAAYRAVALANGANPLAIIIPCHRVIKKNGDLCGYNGGVFKKEWLLKHERGI